MAKITLGYWDLRGLGQPIRTMLEYAGVAYEDKRYSFGQGPEYSRKEWLDEKFKLGLAFPNLPYLIDGDLKITENSAILRHVARRTKLLPEDAKALAEMEMVESVLQGFRLDFLRTLHQANFEQQKPDLKKRSLEKIGMISAFLSDRKFLSGERICYVDFVLNDILDMHRELYCDILESHPNLQSFVERFQSEPKIANYMRSDRYKEYPIASPYAKWGFTK